MCSLTSPTKKCRLLLRQSIQKNVLLRQPIACYEIAKRTYDFVMTYLGNHTINMTFVMLFLVGNSNQYNYKQDLSYYISFELNYST